MTGTSKRFVCSECGKRCKSARGLTQHKETHKDENIIPLNEEEKNKSKKGALSVGISLNLRIIKGISEDAIKKDFLRFFQVF